MSGRSDEPQKIASKTLHEALKSDGGSNRELADRAGISFRSIAEARSGFNPEELQGIRKRLGVVSSTTRLAVSLNVDPGKVLRELGIDVSDAAVQKQIERARDHSFSRASLEDPVVRAIRARDAGPVIGIVPWSPFSDDPGRGSVAKLLARSVLGSLDPTWDRETNVRLQTDFTQAEQRLLSNDPDTPDCLIGLYDLPWRRQGDIDVISLPGLYVKVGGLCTEPIKWNQIMSGRSDDLPHALVIKGDVGDRLLTGPVDYPGGRLLKPPLMIHEPAQIAEQIQPYLKQSRPASGFLFVADGPLVCAVKNHLRDKLHFVGPGKSKWAPAVRFGFAIRHEAERFKELLEEAISEDLFGRALPRTVHLYLELLKLDLTHQIVLDLGELERRAPGLELRFLNIAREFEPKRLKALLLPAVSDRDRLERVIKPIKDKKN